MPRSDLVKCPNCGQLLEDTGQPKFTCRYCGRTTSREEVMDKPDSMRREVMVKTLEAQIARSKQVKLTSYGVAGGFLIFATVLLLLETGYNAPILELIYLVLLFVSGLVWFVVGYITNKGLDRDKSKMFDITGGRTVDYK